jgi:hypothetical protein
MDSCNGKGGLLEVLLVHATILIKKKHYYTDQIHVDFLF